MPKMKTKRAATKRLRLSAGGKLMRRRAFKSHLLEHKSAKRLRKKRRDTGVCRPGHQRGAAPPRQAIGETDGTSQAQRSREEEAP